VSFSINTNISSLQAQDYLRVTSNFQAATINQVTSGLRIVNSGDDAAGLAIANAYRSNEAVLTQGVRNANDGLSQLQIADGGISNISQLLDRARTLATQSASNAFTGDRGVLNSEFQSVLTEINRQAEAIGLNQGGEFAKNLSVFIGGGQASGSVSATTNGSVGLNLTNSTVDAQSLGLNGVQAVNAAGRDLSAGQATQRSEHRPGCQ
jgi:flagellin